MIPEQALLLCWIPDCWPPTNYLMVPMNYWVVLMIAWQLHYWMTTPRWIDCSTLGWMMLSTRLNLSQHCFERRLKYWIVVPLWSLMASLHHSPRHHHRHTGWQSCLQVQGEQKNGWGWACVTSQ